MTRLLALALLLPVTALAEPSDVQRHLLAAQSLYEQLEYERATVQYFYTRQRQLLGLGHAVLCARSFVGNQPFVVALGDSIIGMHAESDVRQLDAAASIAGTIRRAPTRRCVRFVMKPSYRS